MCRMTLGDVDLILKHVKWTLLCLHSDISTDFHVFIHRSIYIYIGVL